MAEKTIRPLGRFSGPGGEVPIFGCESIEVGNRSNWDFYANGPSSTATAIWRGDDVATFNFSFEAFAGLAPLKTRKDLHTAIKAMAGWAQHQPPDGGVIKPPPAVKLSIPGYFRTEGTITECTMNAKAPWELGEPYPTSCHFQGVFVVLPGYEGTAIEIGKLNQKLSSEQISGNLFVL